MSTKFFVNNSKTAVEAILRHTAKHCTTPKAKRAIIRRYVAAIAVNFTDWLGKTLISARHELARYVVSDNLRCESVQDHVGMLLSFAESCDALPTVEDYEAVSTSVAKCRGLFQNESSAGLAGVLLMAYLENTSELFIPVLEGFAKDLGSSNLEYTQCHGPADVGHSEAFIKAGNAEVDMGYPNLDREFAAQKASEAADSLIKTIFVE